MKRPGWIARIASVHVFLLFFAVSLSAQAPSPGPGGIPWEDGPMIGKLGDIAQIRIPEGYKFTGKSGTLRLLELTQNPASGNELGALIPASEDGKDLWFVIFEFHDTGYVKDEEKDKLDADALLKSLQEGTEESNKVRKERGWGAFHVVGWNKPPYYDNRTKNLTWAIRGRGDNPSESETINFSTRILGRRGTMNVDLVLSPHQVETVVPQFEQLIDGFSYVQGQTYAEWKPGDRVAEYGLAALVVGGAAAAAAKSGLLAKFWKIIVIGLVALAGAFKKLFNYVRRMLAGKAAAGEETPIQQG